MRPGDAMPERERVEERRAAGLCTGCGQDAPAPGRAKCEACLEAARQVAAARRELAGEQGLCEACMRRKRAPGRGNRCKTCADKYLARQLKRDRERRKRSGAGT